MMKVLYLIALLLVAEATATTPCAAAIEAPVQPIHVGQVVDAPVAVPEPSAQTVRRYRSSNVLWWISTLWAFTVPAAIFFTGLSARLRDLALRPRRHWYVSLVIYLILTASVWSLSNIPLDFYSDYVRPHAYGLSSQSSGKWLRDDFLSFVVATVGTILVAWIPLLLMRRRPKRWWLYAWFAAVPIMIFVALIEPIWIEPLFNRFGPMHDKALEARILELAARAGVDSDKVYEVDKSTDTNELNAYVTGIGGTRRIVLWDTTLKELAPSQIEQIMAHEIGHYKLLHVWKGLAGGSVALLLGLWFVDVSARWILPRATRRSLVRDMSDMASLPLLVLLLGTVTFLMTPAILAMSRHFEHEADRFGLDLTHDNHTCGMVFVKFVEHDLSYPTPSPLVQFFRSSHPSIAQRIEFCNSYHPWRNE